LPAEGGGTDVATAGGSADASPAAAGAARPATAGEAIRNPVVLSQVLLFMIYTGTEVTAGQWLFSLLTESRGFAAEPAGAAVATFWGALTLGRIVFGQLAASLAPLKIIRFGTLLAPAAALLICWRAGGPIAAFAGAGLLGFALAPIFPMLIAVTPSRVGGRLTAQAVGFQVSAATVGVAALPSLAGVLARPLGLEVIGPFLLIATIALLVQHEVVVRVARRAGMKAEGEG
jgi:fucose permease